MWRRNVNDVMHRKRARRIWGILKKVSQFSSWFGRRRLTFARSPRPCGGCHTLFGADGKVVIERWYLSPYVEKRFNSKVIKSFVPELRRRKCFSCFGIPMFYIYMSYDHYMYVSYIHVWLCYKKRVTCELHDSYFRSTMINTCYSEKRAEVACSVGQLWEEIAWAKSSVHIPAYGFDDDQTYHSKKDGSCMFHWPVIGGDCVGEGACPYLRESLMVI